MTPIAPTPRRSRRPHVKVRKAHQAQREEPQRLTAQIMDAGATAAAAAQAAARLTQAVLTDAELQAWRQDLEARLEHLQQPPEQNLGFIEEQLALAARAPLRLLAQRAAQAKANATPCQGPGCQSELVNQKYPARKSDSRFGALVVFRAYGWGPQCELWHFPADPALGLGKNAPASPYLQEMTALLVSKMPPGQAVPVAQRMGLQLSRRTLDREAHRQGLKAEALRTRSLTQLDTWEGLPQLAAASEGPPAQPFTLIIEIAAWNIRERDDWGQTGKLRAQGQPVARWHWVYVGTVFRLDQRAQTAGGRASISQRACAVTRLGVAALMRQLYREALVCGLGQAREVRVIADGALWLWNAVQDRFPAARQRLELYHGDEPLWAVAHELYGQGTPEARDWVAPLLQALRQDKSPGVIGSLKELQPTLSQALQQKVQTQIEYFENNQHRLQ